MNHHQVRWRNSKNVFLIVDVLATHSFSPSNTSIVYNKDYRDVERELNNARICFKRNGRDVVRNDKYLIFTTGTSTFVPHQIGKKKSEEIRKLLV